MKDSHPGLSGYRKAAPVVIAVIVVIELAKRSGFDNDYENDCDYELLPGQMGEGG